MDGDPICTGGVRKHSESQCCEQMYEKSRLSVNTTAISFASPLKSQTEAASVKTLFSFQAAMDKITEEVRQTILETNQLTQWWENIVTQMKQQDTDSQTCAAVNKCCIFI